MIRRINHVHGQPGQPTAPDGARRAAVLVVDSPERHFDDGKSTFEAVRMLTPEDCGVS